MVTSLRIGVRRRIRRILCFWDFHGSGLIETRYGISGERNCIRCGRGWLLRPRRRRAGFLLFEYEYWKRVL